MDIRVSNPILSYNIEDQYGNIIFKFPPNTLLEKIVDVWQIIIYYHYYYFDYNFTFAIKIMNDDKLNPYITHDMYKACYNIPTTKYEKDFPILKNKNSSTPNKISVDSLKVGARIYRPLTINEVQTNTFLRLFNDACKNSRILYPQAIKYGNTYTSIEIEQKKIIISSKTINSYLYHDEVNNKLITYDVNGYHDISENIFTIQLHDILHNDHRSEQLLVLSNIKFY